jgi:hypothetical protein
MAGCIQAQFLWRERWDCSGSVDGGVGVPGLFGCPKLLGHLKLKEGYGSHPRPCAFLCGRYRQYIRPFVARNPRVTFHPPELSCLALREEFLDRAWGSTGSGLTRARVRVGARAMAEVESKCTTMCCQPSDCRYHWRTAPTAATSASKAV